MFRRGLSLVVALLATLLLAVPSAQARIGQAIDGLQSGVYLEPGVDAGMRPSLEAIVRSHAPDEVVAIVVLSAPHDPPPADRALEVLSMTGADTVLLFTPADFGVASAIRDSATVEAALDRAGEDALGSDTPAAARAILASLTADAPSRLWTILGAVLIVLALGAALFLRVAQARHRAEERAFQDGRAAALTDLDQIAHMILDLEDDLGSHGDQDLHQRLADITSGYHDVHWSLERINRPAQLMRVEQGLEDLRFNISRLRGRLDSPDPVDPRRADQT